MTHCLCTEAGFQLSSLEFLLGGTGQETTNTDKKVFTFRSCKGHNFILYIVLVVGGGVSLSFSYIKLRVYRRLEHFCGS